MSDVVLCLNTGSSSSKFEAFDVMLHDELRLAFRGEFESLGTRPHLTAKRDSDTQLVDRTFTVQEIPDVKAAMARLTEWLHEQYPDRVG